MLFAAFYQTDIILFRGFWGNEFLNVLAHNFQAYFAVSLVGNIAFFIEQHGQRQVTGPIFEGGLKCFCVIGRVQQISWTLPLHFAEEFRNIPINIGEVVHRNENDLHLSAKFNIQLNEVRKFFTARIAPSGPKVDQPWLASWFEQRRETCDIDLRNLEAGLRLSGFAWRCLRDANPA